MEQKQGRAPFIRASFSLQGCGPLGEQYRTELQTEAQVRIGTIAGSSPVRKNRQCH